MKLAVEGGFTKKTFIETWKAINGEYDENREVWVVEFEKVGTTSRSLDVDI